MCFHAVEKKGCGEYLKLQTQTGSVRRLSEPVNERFADAKVFSLTDVNKTIGKKNSLLFSPLVLISHTAPKYTLFFLIT